MSLPALPTPDYLIIGHVTRDLLPAGERLGGTLTYSGLTAAAWGLSVAAVTACSRETSLAELSSLRIFRIPSEQTTTFENRYRGLEREQVVHHVATPLSPAAVPLEWRASRIVHLAPVAGEVDLGLADHFPGALLGLTPQGWLRTWDASGRVQRRAPAPELLAALRSASACVFSDEDVGGDEHLIAQLVEACPIAAVTENARGARIYWNAHVRNIPAPRAVVRDPTGSGDVFAACFFARLAETRDPFEAGRVANLLASAFVESEGLQGIPTREAIARSRLVVEQT